MNYLEVYNRIIYDPKNNLLTKKHGIEYHHIIPRSLGGSSESDNIVKLTFRQHFICHWLLTKIYSKKEKSKMIFAFYFLSHRNVNKYSRLNSNSFAKLKAERSKALSDSLIGNQHAKGMKHTEETRKIQSEANIGNHYAKGYKRTYESKQAQSKRQKGKPNPGVAIALKGNQHGKGSKHTKEWKQTHSKRMLGNKFNLGRKHSKETNEANSSRGKKRLQDPKERQKHSDGSKRRWAKRRLNNGNSRPDDWKFLEGENLIQFFVLQFKGNATNFDKP